jgi:Zn-dependent peptidase ImmA (M78 family)
MAGARAYTTPALLRWARETAAFSLEDAAHRIAVSPERLAQAETGEHLITLKQAQKAASLYGRPLALLFAAEPPVEPSVEAKFRRLRGAPAPPWSPEMVALEREVRQRQDDTVEVYEALGEEPPWPAASERFGLPDHLPSPEEVRAVLGIDPETLRAPRLRDSWYSRRIVSQAVEWSGVLIVRQRVPDDGVRGFLLPHPEVPAIYVNSSEYARAQTYTIVHEFAHLLLAASEHEVADEEAWCDDFAGVVLMPEHEFRMRFDHATKRSAIGTAQELADQFGVSALAAAVRARRLGLFTGAQLAAVKRRPVTAGSESSGGNGNRTKVARLSPTFADLVLAAADSSAVTLSTASRLLKTRVDDFDKLREFTAEALAS